MDNFDVPGSNFGKTFDAGREQVFDRMAPHWDIMISPVSPEKIQELIAVADVNSKTVLDVGAGKGILKGVQFFGWQQVRAVKDDRVYIVSGSYYLLISKKYLKIQRQNSSKSSSLFLIILYISSGLTSA